MASTAHRSDRIQSYAHIRADGLSIDLADLRELVAKCEGIDGKSAYVTFSGLETSAIYVGEYNAKVITVRGRPETENKSD